jgi:hypothetical protein
VWARIAIRTVALANVVLVLLGGLYIERAPSGLSILEGVAKSNPAARSFPHLPLQLSLLFNVLTVINILFLLALLLSTVLIWQFRAMGRWMSTTVFASEIVYWYCWFRVSEFALLRWGGTSGESLVVSLATVDGLGNSGLAAQFDIWYPILALVALNLLYPKLGETCPVKSAQN